MQSGPVQLSARSASALLRAAPAMALRFAGNGIAIAAPTIRRDEQLRLVVGVRYSIPAAIAGSLGGVRRGVPRLDGPNEILKRRKPPG
jgi:hypothetical protein